MINAKYDILKNILYKESGINPDYLDIYKKGFNSRDAVKYFLVKKPGELIRNPINGAPVLTFMSYEQYFNSLGVNITYDDLSHYSLEKNCFRVINPWGFVGIQIGESALFSLGVYNPKDMEINGRNYKVYYDFVHPEYIWKGNNKFELFDYPKGESFICTSYNTWQGDFTGKFGVNNLQDLYEPNKQTTIIYAIWASGINKLCNLIGMNFDLVHLVKYINNEKKFPFEVSESGILAAIHLVGPYKLFEVIGNGGFITDEIGTSAFSYIEGFSFLEIDPMFNHVMEELCHSM
ncbi:hypothetical protein [Photorhabdus heterorhabditis]|uniref:hypothetical protein n=1 Tax=Photorhabdus heterorhabditis TaxID=880156 RepID=UPI001BD45B47|nr:hypothetical protein [Photorhabdus heterorhabditis]MBS9442137.1 hypothetical protein [Photorhabdus heterorhabditis]